MVITTAEAQRVFDRYNEVYTAADAALDAAAIQEVLRDAALAVTREAKVTYQGHACDLAVPFRRLTLTQAVLEHNPNLDGARLKDRDYLAEVARKAGGDAKPEYGIGKLLTEIFEKTVEAKLLDPTFITEYPTEVSPLSRRNDANPDFADRFEFFAGGREIANGFSELNDPDDQAARFRAQAAAHERGDHEAMVYDADYVRALEYGMPPTAGASIGIDRLAMFLTDSPSIRDVLLFPQMRPEA
jgi:lysyl-tRNA synthetase class 2